MRHKIEQILSYLCVISLQIDNSDNRCPRIEHFVNLVLFTDPVSDILHK